jgi:hypothetical protein
MLAIFSKHKLKPFLGDDEADELEDLIDALVYRLRLFELKDQGLKSIGD